MCALCALGGAPGRAAAQALGDPRPAAAIQFRIEAANFRDRLRDDLPHVARVMEQALRRSLAQFGFLNWNAPADQVAYIISIRVVQARTRPRDVFLEVSVQGPGVDAAKPVSLLFERFLERRNWDPQVVARDWARRIEGIMQRERAKLVSNVLGLPPLHAKVTLYPHALQANVRVHPDGIRASRHPTPKFRVLATVKDPGPPLETEGYAELTLGGCNYHAQDGTYVCDIEGLAYKGRPLSPAAEHQQLMERVEIAVHSLHVLEYWPASSRVEQSVMARVGSQ